MWVASVDFREDVVGSEQLMQRIAENYRTIRNNLFRYVLGNLYDFDPVKDALPFEKLEDARSVHAAPDGAHWQLMCERWYGEFAFHKVYQRVLNFCTVELSAFYFDVIKDRLYTYAPNSPGRRAAQTAIWRIGEALVRLLAPVMSFTCEEVWGYLPGSRAQTVHAAQFPGRGDVLGSDEVGDDPKQLEDWSTLLLVRDQVLKALETARNNKLIGKGLEAQVTISAAEPVYSSAGTACENNCVTCSSCRRSRWRKRLRETGPAGLRCKWKRPKAGSVTAVGTIRHTSERIRFIPRYASVAARY